MMTDTVADMLTRIRNAARIERPVVDIPPSKVNRGIAQVLKEEGYIWEWEEVEGQPAGVLRLHLKYGPNGEQVIRHISRTSKPGRRVYRGSKKLPPVLDGLGITILSTSRGIMSDRAARSRNVGGEVLCTVW